MKKRPTPTTSGSSVALDSTSIIRPGTYPRKLNAARSEVLARLLRGERLSGMDAVRECSTTRLAAHIEQIKHRGWTIQVEEIAVGCADGRVQRVARYWLDADVIYAARSTGASKWIDRVVVARRELRAKAALAKRRAAAFNALRARHHRGQGGLFADDQDDVQ